MSFEARSRRRGSGRRGAAAVGAAGAGVGAALAAGVASACCVGPVVAPMVVAVLGAGGAAWAAGLKPYSPYVLAGSGLLLAYAFREVYRAGDVACEIDGGRGSSRNDEEAGSGMGRRGWLRAVVWSAAALWLLSLGLNLFLPAP